jgi:hypothetical protein
MTTRLALARRARELTQSQVIASLNRLADSSGLNIASPSSLKMLLSSFENGRRHVHEPYRTLFRSIYGMTDEELFGSAAEDVASDDQAEYEELAQRIAAGRRVNERTAEALSRQTHYLRTMDCSLGAAHSLIKWRFT